jgi:hypothetical protein
MLDYLQPLKQKNLDFFTFLSGDEEGRVDIMSSEYANPGEKVGGTSLGDLYHIVLFRESKENPEEYDEFDDFEAILACPLEYVSGLIPGGFYGIIARKTTTSHKLLNKLLDMVKKK